MTDIQQTKSYEPNPFRKYWIASTKLFNSTRLKRNSLPCEQFHLNLKDYKELTLCVYRKSLLEYNYINNNSKLIVQENGEVQTSLLFATDYNSLIGYVIGLQNSSKVDGYLYKDRFFGRILIDGNVLYIEDLADYIRVLHVKLYNKEHSIIYQSHNFGINCPEKLSPSIRLPPWSDSILTTLFGKKLNALDYSLRILPSVNFSRRVCTLAIFVDTAYYKLVTNSNDQKTLRSVMHSVNVADSIFRNTDFFGSGKPTNLGFLIKHIQIYKSSHDSPLPSFYPFKRDPKKSLYKFSDLTPLMQMANLAILFTGQTFHGNINGLSFAARLPKGRLIQGGGLCFDHPFHAHNRNALLAVGQGYSSRRTQMALDLTVAHEIGHSFGADHDVGRYCAGHLMDSHLNRMQPGKMDKFSPCAIEDISLILSARNGCLETVDTVLPFCGNGIVEEGEECDCGSKYACEFKKPCCFHFDSQHGKPCTKKTGHYCKTEL